MGKDFVELSNREVRLWVEQGAVHIKAITNFGDPVELAAHEARQLAAILNEMADRADSE